jgi:hypothetical protein
MPHLFVDISAHGFGHLAQTAPVLNRLAELLPSLNITLRSGLSLDKLRQRIHTPFEHIAAASDFGYLMVDALTIDLPATAAAYRAAGADFSTRVAADAAMLQQLQIDVVFANVSYIPLAGAAQAGIPAVAMCSLNWADLFAHYFGKASWAAPIHTAMLTAYRSATFLRTTPAMPMSALDNLIEIGPIAQRGQARGNELRKKVGAGGTATDDRAGTTTRVVLVALGGIPTRLPVESWPTLANTHWLVPHSWGVERADMSAFEPLDWAFADLLRSVDAIVTKPGYGTFAEAVCNGTAVLYQRRDDWPEQDCLIEWLHQHTRHAAITATDLATGNLGTALETCLQAAVPPVPTFDGCETAARHLARILS